MKRWWIHYEANFLWYELAFSLVLTGVGVFIIEFFWGREELEELLKGTRQSLYIAVASIAGSLVGFAVTTVSIILAFSESPRLQLVRDSRHYESVFTVFFSAIKFLAVATAWALVALLWDRDLESHVWISYVALWTVIIAALRLYRCVWVLENVIRLAVKRPADDVKNSG